MVEEILEIRLDNRKLTPDKMSSRDIAKLISAVEEMIAHIVVRDFPELALDQRDVTVGLFEVEIGSYGGRFVSQYDEQVKKAFETAAVAIETREFAKLPTNSVKAIENMVSISQKYDTNTLFGYRNGEFRQIASISSNTVVDVQIPTLESETVLYGRLTSIGGEKPPTARLVLLDGKKLTCNVTEKNDLAIAKELGKRLYTEIGVRGMARWNLQDMSIVFFRIDELLDYEQKPLHESLENSYEILGHHLEQISDLEQFFSDLRNGGEND